MKKAIKLTQENIYSNKHLFKNKKVGDLVIYTEYNFPKVFNNANVSFNSDLPDFSEVVEPILNENQQIDTNLNNGVLDNADGTFTYNVIDITQPTEAEQIAIDIENIEVEYELQVTNIKGLKKAIIDNILDGTAIPQDILDERNILKADYDIKIKDKKDKKAKK